MAKLYHKRNDCRLCRSTNLELVVPLAPMPAATPTFKVGPAISGSEVYKEAVPLDLYLCMKCGHLQLLHVVDPRFIYSNYLYRTAVSLGLVDHFAKSAEAIIGSIRPAPGSLVVEIGSNDGSQLRPFQAQGFGVLGVDPAEALAQAATRAGVKTMATFFTAELAGRIRREHGSASIILANNVFANVDNLEDMTRGVRNLLDPGGVFVFQTQYGADVVERLLLDTIYHEHLSYFHVKPLQLFFAEQGLELFNVERIWTKGGSIRVSVQRAGGPRPIATIVGELISEEERRGLFLLRGYRKMAAGIERVRTQLDQIIAATEAKAGGIAGYGVSVGTTALIPQFCLSKKLRVLFDDDPDKIGMLAGPDYQLPVMPPSEVLVENPAIIVVFAWRYIEPIMEKHAEWRRRGGKFVIPLPHVVVK